MGYVTTSQSVTVTQVTQASNDGPLAWSKLKTPFVLDRLSG
jgi:hypothetical protein